MYFIPAQPGTTLLYYTDGELTSEPGVAWVFDMDQRVEDGFHAPNLIGAFGGERATGGGAAVLMPNGEVYSYETVFQNLEKFLAHMDDTRAPFTASKPAAATPAAPSLWEVKEPSELPPSLAALV